MSVALHITVNRTGGMPDSAVVREAMRAWIREASTIVEANAVRNVSGRVLNVQTGQLRSSIGTTVTDRDNGVEASVGTNVAHGVIHEFGVSRGWTITSRGEGPLSWLSGGQRRFAWQVTRGPLPARPWLVPALREAEPAVMSALSRRIDSLVEGQTGST